MAVTAVTLESGQVVRVKRLGLFVIEHDIPRDVPGDYTVTVLFANGEIYEQPFDISVVREKPDKPFEDCQENTAEYYQWREYLRWQNGIVHYQSQIDALDRYFERVERYILDNCLSDDDRQLIETWQDFNSVYEAAIPDMPDGKYLEAIATNIFQAKWGEVSAFEAYHNLDGSDGSYAWIPQRIMELIIKLGETEERFLERSKREIGMMMVADLLPRMMEALQSDKAYKDMKVNNDATN